MFLYINRNRNDIYFTAYLKIEMMPVELGMVGHPCNPGVVCHNFSSIYSVLSFQYDYLQI